MNEIYKMTVDLNVLDHLGINLYSNIAAVLTEAVANAWDADAKKVDIVIDPNSKCIEITDNGVGMSVQDMNKKYLRVGYQRRKEDAKYGKQTKMGRKVMGRKGLGKLSLFSIAEIIEVQSAKNGESHGLRMSADGIRESVRKREPFYKPEPLPNDEIAISRGTQIILKNVKRQRLNLGIKALRNRLARRFSVIGELYDFKITIDGQPIVTADRGDLPMVQFLWTLGDFKPDPASIPAVVEKQQLPQRIDSWEDGWRINGWIGTARYPKQLDNKDAGNLNSIVVLARGRLLHENILDKLNDGRLYTKYITGHIEADFLDTDDDPDIVTSDRQRIQEDDPRYTQLLSFLKLRLTQIEKRWTDLRQKYEIKEVKKTSPALAKWLESLSVGHRKTAEKLIAKLSALPIDEEDDRKLMYRHGILAFERMKLRGSTEELVSGIQDIDKVLAVLADRDALEAALYCDIVKTRLDAIKNFIGIVDDDAKEGVLQKYLFDHLWLLDPAWERATSSKVMESRLTTEGVLVDDLTEKEKLGRVDIAYRTNSGKHIIVELKKAGRKMKLLDLQSQGQLYVDKLRKILLGLSEQLPNIEVVFVLGKPVEEESSNPDRVKSSMAAVSPGSRIIHYDALIQGALNAYSEYLEESRNLDQLEQIIDQL